MSRDPIQTSPLAPVLPENRSQTRRAFTAAATLLAVLGCGAPELPPHGQVRFEVDTDVPAPRMAGRLRVDLFTLEGRWYESIDFPRPDGSSWPASFTLYTERDAGAVQALVRLRLYPEGKVRDYRGERFEPRATFRDPFVAGSLAELCGAPPRLELGRTLRLRRGASPLVQDPSLADCGTTAEPTVGSSAAFLDVLEARDYRVAVLETHPPRAQVTLELRRVCDDAGTAVQCESGILGPSTFVPPSMKVPLEVGRYYVVTGGSMGPAEAADLVLGAAPEEEFDDLSKSRTEEPQPPDAPRLLAGDEDVTPSSEPLPALAIDRLVAVHVEPSTFGTVRVLLRGACLGTMAKLSAAPPFQRVSLAEAGTCVDLEDVREPLSWATVEATPTAPATSAAGSFGVGSPCPPATNPAGPAVCVPGGVFALGGPEWGGRGVFGSTPERVAVLPTFWIDRHEVTVGAWLEALSLGFDPAGAVPSPAGKGQEGCTLGPDPTPGERRPLNCVPWEGARRYCQFRGGDLPTEAQWEFVASAAVRAGETRFPWGDEPPRCDCTGADGSCRAPDLAHAPPGGGETPGELLGSECRAEHPVNFPLPVDATMGEHGDVVEIAPGVSVHGLAGGVMEWALDAAVSYARSCWRSQPLTSPSCREAHPTDHVTRGGSWRSGLSSALTTRRAGGPASGALPDTIGFRCAYEAEP